MRLFQTLFLLLLPFVVSGCMDGGEEQRAPLRKDDFGKWDNKAYRLSGPAIRSVIDVMRREGNRMYADKYVKQYYASGQPFVWITRSGVDWQGGLACCSFGTNAVLRFVCTIFRGGGD